jgi:hypothetical protein
MGMKISEEKFNEPLSHSIHSFCFYLHFNVNFILSLLLKSSIAISLIDEIFESDCKFLN